MQDALSELLDVIKDYAKQNRIVVLRGTPLEESKFISIPVEIEKDDWMGFFSVIHGLELKAVNIALYQIREDLITEEMKTFYSTLEGEKKKAYKTAMDTIAASVGFVESITLSFFYQSVRYFFEIESQLTSLYDLLLDAELEEHNQETEMSEDEMEGLAMKIAREERYIKASKGERGEVARELIEQNKGAVNVSDEDIYEIIYRAKRYFEKEVQPELDKELEKQVLRLKKQGSSKAAVKGLLNITDTRINKFWYA